MHGLDAAVGKSRKQISRNPFKAYQILMPESRGNCIVRLMISFRFVARQILFLLSRPNRTELPHGEHTRLFSLSYRELARIRNNTQPWPLFGVALLVNKIIECQFPLPPTRRDTVRRRSPLFKASIKR